MFATYQSLPLMLQIYWALAILASAVFVIQTIMTFMGFDADGDVDVPDAADAVPESGGADFDADGFHLVSVKSLISFVLGFGWTGVLFWNSISNTFLLGLAATLVGFVFMGTIAFLIFQVMKLNKDNTFRIEQIVGQTAEVYLRITADRKESGKITISHHGSTHELEAFSDQEIPTGAKVRILSVIDGETVLVEAI